MKICPYCHYDLPDDATFCTHCGKQLEEAKDNKENKTSKKQRAKIQSIEAKKLEQARRNIWNPIGLILFLVAFVGFDWVLGMIFNSMNWDYKIIYTISAVLYVLAFGCAIMSIREARLAKKDGKEPSGNAGIPVALISFSCYILLLNFQNIILK